MWKLTFIFATITIISTIHALSYLDGSPTTGEKLVYRRFVKAVGAPLQKQRRQIVYPIKGQNAGPVITFINATDLSNPTSNKGGKVQLFSGGVDEVFAVLDFTSALSRGLDFDVRIYAKYN